MARGSKPEPYTESEPTAPRPRDANGYELDEFGLPLVGPARIDALGTLGLPDPHEDPAAWAKVAADEVAAKIEQSRSAVTTEEVPNG